LDHPYILTETLEQARELQRLAEQQQREADNVEIMEDKEERFRALATSDPGSIISSRWD